MKRNALLVLGFLIALLAPSSAQVSVPWCDVAPIVTPNTQISVRCWVYDYHVKLKTDIQRITNDQALAFYGKGSIAPLNGAVIATSPLYQQDRSNFAALLKSDGPGAYGVRIYSGDILVRTLVTTVSRFGLITIAAPGMHLYAPVDLTTQRVFREPLDVVSASDSDKQTLRVASDGLYEAPLADARHLSPTTYATAADGSIAFIAAQRSYYSNDAVIFAQTDRPVYRPGDTVYFHAISRLGHIGTYTPATESVQVEFAENYPEHTIAKRTITPDGFGGINAEFKLPADAELGTYVVNIDKVQRAYVNVQAYKKPEYSLTVTPAENYVIAGGDARFKVHLAYLFGATASNLTLHYSSYTTYWNGDWFGPYHDNGYHSDYSSANGDAVTDANGDATIVLPTKREGLDGRVQITLNARDESGRTVSTESSLTVVRGTFHTLVQPKSWVANVNETSSVDVTTLGHDGKPYPFEPLHVRIYQARWLNDDYKEEHFEELDIRTDLNGKATFSYLPTKAAEYRFEVSGVDGRGDTVASSQSQWVVDPNNSSWAPHVTRPQLIPDKTVFAPGERLAATLVLAHPAQEAIFTLSTDHLIAHTVKAIDGMTARVEFAAPKGAELATLQTCVPDESGVACTQLAMQIAPTNRLQVTVIPSKASYQPGERAKFVLHVVDTHGHPVRAQLSLGVIDQGVYEIASDNTEDPARVFYQRATYVYAQANWYRPNYTPPLKMIAKVTSRAAGDFVKAGVGSDVYNVNSAAIAAVPARSHFVDTAYWTPAVTTDAHGNATVSFAWPDNLTTWIANANAVTVATQLGTAHATVLVTKKLLARLETPRFLRAGDTASITGIVHGVAAGNRVGMQLDARPIATMAPPIEVKLNGSKRASATWNIGNGYVGKLRATLRATDGTNTDGMQLDLPLLGGTPMGHVRSAGTVNSTTAVPIDLGSGEMAGTLHVSFAPSMMAQIAQTLRVFDVYPYYCTEQTSSNGIVAAALLMAGGSKGNLDLANEPQKVIARARERLSSLEHSRGAFGWWSQDRDSIFMTAYSLYAQIIMNRAMGDHSSPWMVDRTSTRLAEMMKTPDKYDRDEDVALASYALALTTPNRLPMDVFEKQSRDLPGKKTLAIAYIGLAAKQIGNNDVAERAAQLLIARSQGNGGARFWRDGNWTWQWWSDPIASTSLAALLLHNTGHDVEAQEALTFIREQRNGDWWYTTLDTAMATMAIAQIEGPDAVSKPNETARVLVDGKPVATVKMTSLIPDAADTRVVISSEVMRHAKSVSIERSGDGRLYWSSDFEKYVDARAGVVNNAGKGVLTRLFAQAPALAVNRRYTVGHAGAWRVGDDVTCDIWITARDGAEYVTLEDPYPAGTEYQTLRGQNSWGWSGEQFLDDHAAFFFRWLWPGQTEHFTYHLRAITAGNFGAPGPSAFASYGPPVAAVGTGERVTIQP